MLFKDEDYKDGLEKLKTVRIKLESDPIGAGVDRINALLAEINGQRDFVNSLLVEAIRNRAAGKILYEKKKVEYSMELDRLSSEDEDVRRQKSADSRKSMANTKAAQLQLEEHTAKIELFKSESYFSIVQQHYHNVESSFETLSRQISSIQLAIGSGLIRSDDLGKKQPGKEIKFK